MTKDELRDVVRDIDTASPSAMHDFLDELLEYVWCTPEAQDGGGMDPLTQPDKETDGRQDENGTS